MEEEVKVDQTDKCSKPELETILIQSVICSKEIRLVASAKTNLVHNHDMNIRFVPDQHNIKITGYLLKDFIVLQGSVQGDIIINHECYTRVTLLFQEEIVCEGVCPGDVLSHTEPILEGVIPPQCIMGDGGQKNTIIFKVILSTQVTVVREKIGKISINIIGDVNEDRCRVSNQMDAVVPITQFDQQGSFIEHRQIEHHQIEHHQEEEEDQ